MEEKFYDAVGAGQVEEVGWNSPQATLVCCKRSSDLLRMEFHFVDPGRQLIVILEPGFPAITARQCAQKLPYGEANKSG